MTEIPQGLASSFVPRSPQDQKIYAAAQKLEASFLSEMLKAAGLGKPPEAFGGGAGEEHFASFLTQEYANALSRAGGIGLAESLFLSLKENQGD